MLLASAVIAMAGCGQRTSARGARSVHIPPGAQLVSVDLDHPANRFRPDQALGAGVDGQDHGDIARIYTPPTLRAMRSAGLRPLSYRLRTELGVQAWHWNPRGSWSDGAHHQGYWTSSVGGPPIAISYGYRLPRRGDTIDQANDNGYSRLDDGDPHSFWKSNPYLDSRFTRQPESAHPQWVLIDLHAYRAIDAIAVDWGTPYATHFEVQRWIGPSAIALAGHPPGHWQDFPTALFGGRGSHQSVRIAAHPLSVRFVRVLLHTSSYTAPRGSRDIRDRLGFAIRELYLGRLDHGRLLDVMRHRPSNAQTVTMASSTDPWHRASDRDLHTEQPGLDRVAASGLTNGLAMLAPVAVLYGTPENAAAELRYLRRRHIALTRMELGEEPDGQLASPEDYAALYRQYAVALHAVDPSVALGGPGFQTSIPDWMAWPDANGNRSWTNRFLAALRAQGDLADLRFFSFEWYPFDNTCASSARQLAGHSATLAAVIRRQREHGLAPGLPLLITEYGYSAFAGRAEVDRAGALLNADVVGRFLTEGGSSAYLYGYEPSELIREVSGCNSYGNLTLLQSDSNRRIIHRLATYWAARMLTQDWTLPGDGLHTLYRATVTPAGVGGRAAGSGRASAIGAYPVRRPDGRLAVLLLNHDPVRSVTVSLQSVSKATSSLLAGPLAVISFSATQYVWHARAANGFPRPDLPPARSGAPAGARIVLAPYSLTVVRTRPGR